MRGGFGRCSDGSSVEKGGGECWWCWYEESLREEGKVMVVEFH